MSDASIQAYALEKGLAASTEEMTPQIKAAAALDILFDQTADSAGQFARESDTLAGAQQILTAKVENAKAAIGEQLAPAVSGGYRRHGCADPGSRNAHLGTGRRRRQQPHRS